MNEFVKIHPEFIEDQGYRLSNTPLIKPLYIPEWMQQPNKDYSTLKKEHCKHEFKQYIGMVETFEYCIHCDTKKVA